MIIRKIFLALLRIKFNSLIRLMRFKKHSRKFLKNCNNQLALDFKNSNEIVVNIHSPKHSTLNSPKNSIDKQRFIIRLCES